MEKRLLLIADSDPVLRQTLTEILGKQYLVHSCGTGTEALALLHQLKPHILVLDLTLPELDGLSLMQMVVPDGRPPVILGSVLAVTDYVSDAARKLGISYVMRRPCIAEAVAMRVEDLCSWACESESRAFIAGILESLGFIKTHSGSRFLPLAVEMEANDPGQSLTKVIYPEVGKRSKEQASGKKVEKDIRYAIGRAWERGNRDAWKRYFPQGSKPSNGEFIAAMAELLTARVGEST